LATFALRRGAALRAYRIAWLINFTVTVVVNAVARFYGSKMDATIGVVAVPAAAYLGRIAIPVLVENTERADGARSFALDIGLTGVACPVLRALCIGRASRRRDAAGIQRAVVAGGTRGHATVGAN
jgi:hypothetical protein